MADRIITDIKYVYMPPITFIMHVINMVHPHIQDSNLTTLEELYNRVKDTLWTSKIILYIPWQVKDIESELSTYPLLFKYKNNVVRWSIDNIKDFPPPKIHPRFEGFYEKFLDLLAWHMSGMERFHTPVISDMEETNE